MIFYNDEIIDINSCDFLTPTLLLPLLTFSYNYNKKIQEHINPNINDYLYKILGIKKHTNTTYPFRWVDETHDNSEELTREIFKIMQPKKNMNQPLRYIFHEVLTNVYDHSKFDKGFVIAQHYPKIKSADYAFMDNGVSIPGSFANSNFSFKNDCDAIIQAINGKSTREGEDYVGRGTGLNSIVTLVVEGNNGSFLIASRKGVIEIEKNRINSREIPEDYIKGTLINFRLKSNNPIDFYENIKGKIYTL